MTIKITKEKYDEIGKMIMRAYRYSLDGVTEYVLFVPQDGRVWVSHLSKDCYGRLPECIVLYEAPAYPQIRCYGEVFLKYRVDYPNAPFLAASVDWDDPNHRDTTAYKDLCDSIVYFEEHGHGLLKLMVDSALKRNDIEVES